MNGDYWYYTLSTIAQTLAALIALSATFVIFKLDKIETQKQDFIKRNIRYLMILNPKTEDHNIALMNDNELINLLTVVDKLDPSLPYICLSEIQYKKLIKERKHWIAQIRASYPITPKRAYDFLVNTRLFFINCLKIKDYAFERLKGSLWRVSSAILLALILLPLYKLIACACMTFIYVLLIIAVSISIWSVVYTARSMLNIALDKCLDDRCNGFFQKYF